MPGSALADIRDSYGVVYIGLILSAILYGVTMTQTWIYYWHYHGRDPMTVKGFVATLFILDTLFIILSTHSVYWYLILNFGNVVNLDFGVWSINVQSVLNGIIGYLVQLFYARRVYILSKSTIVPAIIALLGGITFALGVVFAVKSFQIDRFSRYSSMKWVTCVGMSTNALADILIALSMCWYLYHKRTGFSKTDSMIITLMGFSINSGLLTSILATSTLISFVIRPGQFYWELFFWLMGRCYVNSFLAILNNRDNVRERSSGEESGSAFQLGSIRKNGISFKPQTCPTAVAVTVNSMATADFATSMRTHDNKHESGKSEGRAVSLSGSSV